MIRSRDCRSPLQRSRSSAESCGMERRNWRRVIGALRSCAIPASIVARSRRFEARRCTMALKRWVRRWTSGAPRAGTASGSSPSPTRESAFSSPRRGASTSTSRNKPPQMIPAPTRERARSVGSGGQRIIEGTSTRSQMGSRGEISSIQTLRSPRAARSGRTIGQCDRR